MTSQSNDRSSCFMLQKAPVLETNFTCFHYNTPAVSGIGVERHAPSSSLVARDSVEKDQDLKCQLCSKLFRLVPNRSFLM